MEVDVNGFNVVEVEGIRKLGENYGSYFEYLEVRSIQFNEKNTLDF